jgi:hypothetical protein
MMRKMQTGLSRFFAIWLSQTILCQPIFAGQEIGLKIIVVTGSGTENIINEIPPEPFAVRVMDANNRPVPGATVVFTAPSNGAGGAFPTGPSFTTLTDEQGRALGVLYRPNAVEGSYMIQVRADYLGEVAMASIRQNNVLSKKSSKKMLVILAVAGAGAAIAAGGLSRGGDNNAPNNPQLPIIPTITFGGSTVGGQ